jgi:hypothetical protein
MITCTITDNNELFIENDDNGASVTMTDTALMSDIINIMDNEQLYTIYNSMIYVSNNELYDELSYILNEINSEE